MTVLLYDRLHLDTQKLKLEVWFHALSQQTTLSDQACQWFATGQWFSPGTPDSSINKTDCHPYNWNIFAECGVKHP